MKKIKLLGKIGVYLFMLFLVFNIGLYLYCYITPKISINKNQSYYLYDSVCYVSVASLG